MDGETVRVVVAAVLGGVAGVVVLASLLFRVGGTWVRVLDDEARREGRRAERLTLTALGPFVSGRSDDLHGHHEYSGFQLGRRVYLSRRDHGVRMLVERGYPEPIARRQDGQVAAKLALVVDDGRELAGTFSGLRIEFTHQPPRVTAIVPMPAEPRRYRRVVDVDEPALDAALEPPEA